MFFKKKREDKKEQKRKEFIKAGGGLSGVYDISDKKTAAFVKKYREFIPNSEIYTRNEKGWLVPVYKTRKGRR